MEYRQKYIDIILHIVLGLQPNEGLSINVEQSQVEFASELAQKASEISCQDVHVVVIESGTPSEVLTFSPIEQEKALQEPTQHVLLRIDDTEDHVWHPDATPVEIIENYSLLQQVGNLAPPQLDKPVAPWAVIAVPGPKWACRILGTNKNEKHLWELLAPILKLDNSDPLQAWKEQVSLVNHRLSTLNRLDIQSIQIQTDSTDLIVGPVEQSRWRGGLMRLDSGRSFIPMLPLERITMLPKRTITSGLLSATHPIKLLGTDVIDAKFYFEHGEVVAFDAAKGKEILDLVFTKDRHAKLLGELSLIDELSSPSSYCNYFETLCLDNNISSSMLFGMGEAIHLEALDTYADAFEMEEKTGCNMSEIRFRVPFGSPELHVSALCEDNSYFEIVKDGRLWS